MLLCREDISRGQADASNLYTVLDFWCLGRGFGVDVDVAQFGVEVAPVEFDVGVDSVIFGTLSSRELSIFRSSRNKYIQP